MDAELNSFSPINTFSAFDTARVPFIQNDVHSWFVQLEANMAMRGLTSQTKKFHFCIGNLPAHIIPEIADLAENPPASNPYDMLKEVVLARMAVSEQKKIQQLLTTETLGDRKPSQLLRHMRSLAGNANDNIVRHIFLNRMPINIQPILATLDKDASLDKVAEVADQILDQTTYSHPTINTSTVHENNELKKMVVTLTQQMEAMGKRLEALSIRHPRGRSSSRKRAHSRSRSSSPSPYCWYHHRFRERARKCVQPCSFKHLN